MFVLVTGGAGFIGSHTVDALLENGAKVRILDNLSTGSLENIPMHHNSLEFVHGDTRDNTCLAACMKGITHVLHLAAQVSVPISIQDPLISHSINVTGFLNVLDAARLAGVARVVHASSAAVYGIPLELPLTEDSKTVPLSPYGLEKLVMDQYATLFRQLYNISTIGLRYFNVYGPRQNPDSPYSGVISKFAAWARQQQSFTLFGDGLQTRDFIYVKDVAHANCAALVSTKQGVVNIATGHSVTILEITQLFSDIVEYPISVEHKPARIGDIPYSSVRPLVMKNEFSVNKTVSLHNGLRELLEHTSMG